MIAALRELVGELREQRKDTRRYFIRNRAGLYWSARGGWVKGDKAAKVITGQAAAWAFVDDRIDEDDEGIYLAPA